MHFLYILNMYFNAFYKEKVEFQEFSSKWKVIFKRTKIFFYYPKHIPYEKKKLYEMLILYEEKYEYTFDILQDSNFNSLKISTHSGKKIESMY